MTKDDYLNIINENDNIAGVLRVIKSCEIYWSEVNQQYYYIKDDRRLLIIKVKSSSYKIVYIYYQNFSKYFHLDYGMLSVILLTHFNGNTAIRSGASGNSWLADTRHSDMQLIKVK